MDEFGNDVCKGLMIPTQPGVIVHNKPLDAGFAKFQVTEAVNDGYDSDITADAFVAWELSKTKVHLKSRGTDCKICDNFYTLNAIFVLSLKIDWCGHEVNFTLIYFPKNQFLQ